MVIVNKRGKIMEDNNSVDNIPVLKLTLGEKVKNFFVNPQKLFEYYKDNESYGIRLLIVVVCSAITALILAIASKDKLSGAVSESVKGVDPATAATAQKLAGVFTSPISAVITTIIVTIIAVYFMSLVYFLIAKIFKSTATYRQMVGVYLISYFSVLIGGIIKAIYDIIANKPLDLAAIAEATANMTIADILITKLNVFGLWQMVLIAIGIAVIGNISKKKSAAVVIIVWTLGFILAIGSNSIKNIVPPTTSVSSVK